MLFDDKTKLVELFMDNVIWGNVEIDLNKWDIDKKVTPKSIATAFDEWVSNRIDKKRVPMILLYNFTVFLLLVDLQILYMVYYKIEIMIKKYPN